MNIWIIVIMIIFAGESGRIDIKPLPGYQFESAMKCFEFKNSKEFEEDMKIEAVDELQYDKK